MRDVGSSASADVTNTQSSRALPQGDPVWTADLNHYLKSRTHRAAAHLKCYLR